MKKTSQYDFTGKRFIFSIFIIHTLINSLSKFPRIAFVYFVCLVFILFVVVILFFNYRYKFSVLALTYVAYTCYHLTRKPISVVKTVLHRNCSLVDVSQQVRSVTDASNQDTWCDYAPFGKLTTTKTEFESNKQINEIKRKRKYHFGHQVVQERVFNKT